MPQVVAVSSTDSSAFGQMRRKDRNQKLRLPLRRLCGCSAMLLEEAILGGDNLIDLIIEDIRVCGFARSQVRAPALASLVLWLSIA
jgi:hypothetical protein